MIRVNDLLRGAKKRYEIKREIEEGGNGRQVYIYCEREVFVGAEKQSEGL